MVDGQLPCVSQNIVKVIYQKDGVMEEKSEIKMDKVLRIYWNKMENKFKIYGYHNKKKKKLKIDK